MALKLRNRWNYKGKDWWEWEAFIDDEGSGDLSQIDFVEYVLHPTFVNRARKVSDMSNGFLMKTSGWGTFRLKAFVTMKDDTVLKLEHEIELKYDPTTGVSS